MVQTLFTYTILHAEVSVGFGSVRVILAVV